ncbi:FeoB-associated Cys-rich membrane protein [Pseudodesulfovibrio sp. S3]|nr:FeoB-associated Cys-rich membrane protein [Pseudodesulfovibrio sp. S3-i]RWU05392.1 FeoB-associated Cys-rich membrane protein [Pseudodesulfovibrio sp. S3]
MLDTIIVAAIVIIAAVFVARRLLKPFISKNASCGCSGCGQSGSCSTIQGNPNTPGCSGKK